MFAEKIVRLLLVIFLSGCSSPDVTTSNSADSGTTLASVQKATIKSGSSVALALSTRYADTRENCGKESMPAFLCSGVILRGTEASTQYDSWNPSPTAIRVGGVSFSYIRSDYNIRRLAFDYSHGYILMPVLDTPSTKYQMEILCFFPVDGASDNRSESGCGPTATYPVDSVPCGRQGITTGEQWRDHFNRHPTVYQWRCGFDVRDDIDAVAGRNFYQGLHGGRLVSPNSFNTPNDLKVKVWPQNVPGELPIEAFMYTLPAGLAGAQYDQKRFYSLTNIALPIISVKLPAAQTGSATFTYMPTDQVILIP